MYPLNDTIAAIASVPGGAARGIVRLSGPLAYSCITACFSPAEGPSITAGRSPHSIAGSVRLEGISAPLPCETYYWPEGHSFTGQTVVELHTLGSPPLLNTLLQTLCAQGVRPAQPGEFTLRAFLSGRIDLTQAEAVLGAIDAVDDREFEAALRQLAGGLSGPLRQLRCQLLDLLAHLEAGFDFTDEDIHFIAPEELQIQIEAAQKQVSELLSQLTDRSLSESAVRVVFVGRPNTGKSSLFNALIRRTGAIVSPQPGTTRDYLTAEGEFGGVKCVWIDTAGIPSEDFIPSGELAAAEKAVQAAQEQHALATVRLICLEAGRPPDEWEQNVIAQSAGCPRLIVLTKADLVFCRSSILPLPSTVQIPSGKMPLLQTKAIFTSSITGEGLDNLRHALGRVLRGAAIPAGEIVPGTAIRCRQSLIDAAEAMRRAAGLLQNAGGEELVAAEIRSALEELGQVVGGVCTEDLLDRIFSRFCIGK